MIVRCCDMGTDISVMLNPFAGFKVEEIVECEGGGAKDNLLLACHH